MLRIVRMMDTVLDIPLRAPEMNTEPVSMVVDRIQEPKWIYEARAFFTVRNTSAAGRGLRGMSTPQPQYRIVPKVRSRSCGDVFSVNTGLKLSAKLASYCPVY